MSAENLAGKIYAWFEPGVGDTPQLDSVTLPCDYSARLDMNPQPLGSAVHLSPTWLLLTK